MIRILLFSLSVLSLFWFPYPYTLVLSFVASLYFPPAAFLIGIGADLLYLPSGTFPLASAVGLGLSLFSVFVHRFTKARIIS